MENHASRMQLLDAAQRLSPRPVLLAAWHRGAAGRAWARRALRDQPFQPAARFFSESASPAPPPPLAPRHAAEVLRRASRLESADRWWHGGYDAAAPALALDPFAAGDIRPVWERNRW